MSKNKKKQETPAQESPVEDMSETATGASSPDDDQLMPETPASVDETAAPEAEAAPEAPATEPEAAPAQKPAQEPQKVLVADAARRLIEGFREHWLPGLAKYAQSQGLADECTLDEYRKLFTDWGAKLK